MIKSNIRGCQVVKLTKIFGMQRLENKLKRLPDLVKAHVRVAMEKSADETVAMMKNLVPVKSGELRDSIGWTWGNAPKYSQRVAQIKSDENDLAITIYAGNSKVRYAHLVEFGSKPHVIVPKRAKALGKDGSLGVRVEHPGSHPNPFFWPSWKAKRSKTRSRIRRAAKKAMQEIAKGSG